jgi:holo-[acyl-carrier protein] synthase
VVVGLGIDVCDIDRMRRALERSTGERFIARVFTAAERTYCDRRHRGRIASYAARFAAKEAALKALGTGWSDGITWQDVEVVRPEEGPPILLLHGRAATIARKRGITRWLVAMSHSDLSAVASVVAERDN